MSNLFVVLLLGAIGGIFYFRKKDKKKRNIAIGVAIISFILFGLTSPEVEDGYEASKESETQENSTNEPVEESSTSESSEEVTYDDPLEQSAHDVFGEDLRSFNVIEDSGMKDIYVEANIPMNLTANMMKGSFEMDVLDYAKKVKAEEFSNIIYMATLKQQILMVMTQKWRRVQSHYLKKQLAKLILNNFQEIIYRKSLITTI